MENILQIIRISSKKGFKNLRDNSPYYCNDLGKNFEVTRTFQNHISGYNKTRVNRDIIERLSILNLIDDISEKGKVIEKREKGFFEGSEYKNTYKISLRIKTFYFIIIVGEKYNGNYLLLSCFVKKIITKKD